MLAWLAMRRSHLAVSVVAALLLGAIFAGDTLWVSVAALLLAGAWAALALLGRAAFPASGLVLVGLLLATAAWSGLSIAWSVAPDLSWDELDRTLVYAAFLLVGLLFAAAASSTAAAGVVTVVFGAAIVWALAGKAIPGLFPDGGRTARLRDPIGYWNALALAGDVLLVLALSFAATSRRLLLRLGAGVLAYAAVVAIFLAASRAGVVAAAIGVVLWLWLRRDRVEAALLALAAGIPAVAVAAWAFTRPALVDDGASRSDRVADGAWFGLLVLVGAGVVALAARELDRRPLGPATRRAVSRVLRGAAVVAAVAIVVGSVANAGRIADEFRGEEVRNNPQRFLTLSSNNRAAWWEEARKIAEAEPLLGAGANTFEVARKRYRESASAVTQPHSVPLQFLAGTGIVGLALLLALVGAVGAAAVGAVQRAEGAERDAAAALAVGLVLWLGHALVDYPWNFVAVTGPVLFAAGALAASGRSRVFPKHRALAAGGVAALALAAVVSAVTPWLAERSVRDADAAIERGDLEDARGDADRARSLDPLSLEPLFARARVEEAAEDEQAARDAYGDAAGTQPDNPASW